MEAFRLVLIVVVLVGMAAAILLFEKKRASRIESDLKQMRRETRPGDRPADRRS